MIYLDSAATTLQKPASVSAAAAEAIGKMASPGRGGHPAAMLAADTAYRCRCAAAELFHVPDPSCVIFTFNATHGLNIAVRSLVRPGSRVLISGYEHNAVTRALASVPNVSLRAAASPLFDRPAALAAFEAKLDKDTDAVICTHVSNVFGAIMPIEEIADLCAKKHVPLIIDASQSAGVLPIDFQALGAAFIAMPGHKGLYGPQGTGLLLCGETAPTPVLYGGTGSDSIRQSMPPFLPDALEAGTHNMPGIAGLLEGLNFVRRMGTERIRRHENKMISLAVKELAGRSGIELFYSDDPESQTGVLSLRIRGVGCEEAGERLGAAGYAVRAGLHCAPLAHKTAGTIGTGTVRVSVSAFNTEAEMRKFTSFIKKSF